MSFVEVAVARPVRQLFTYREPDGVTLVLGHVVQVPFGRQKVTGYVISKQDSTHLKSVKSVTRLIDPLPAFDAHQLKFFDWISKYYLSGLGEVISTALPSRYKAKFRRVYIPTNEGIEALATEDLDAENASTMALREIIAKPARTRGGIERGLSTELEPKQVQRAIEALLQLDWISVEDREQGQRSGRITTISLSVSPKAIPIEGGIRMRGVLARLAEAQGTLDLPTLIKMEGATARDAVKRLEVKGLVTVGHREDRGAAI